MSRPVLRFPAAWLAACVPLAVQAQPSDPRLKEVWYDPNTVVTVPVKRGVVTHIVLDEQESITDVGSGLGSDCARVDASWCIAAQAGGRNIFVKPKTTTSGPNNLAVVTDKRSHAFRFVVLPDGDARAPVYRLSIKVPIARRVAPIRRPADLSLAGQLPLVKIQSSDELIEERLKAAPEVVNSEYSIAEGPASADIVPALIFDDGRFTYLRFPNNREVPAVFHVQEDGAEALVNARMEGDLLVIDRVSRRLTLRSGSAVVGVWNEAFDQDGIPPNAGSTVSGIERSLRAESAKDVPSVLPGARP